MTASPSADQPDRQSGRLLTRRMAQWLDDRLGLAGFARTALGKVFPDHWSFMIGELALYCFIVLIVTGTYLGFFFDASTAPPVYTVLLVLASKKKPRYVPVTMRTMKQ